MTVYISGPITGRYNGNAEAFHEAEGVILACKHWPVNPHRIGEDVHTLYGGRQHWRVYMKHCIRELVMVDSVIMLDGWELSRGARVERLIARVLDIAVYESLDEYKARHLT